jgi:hypothetical protein
MASPPAGFQISSPALDQWRPNGDRLSYSDAAWMGVATAIVMHAALHFFSVAIPSLESLLIVFGPPERFAFALSSGTNAIARWLLLLLSVAAWGGFIGLGLLVVVHEVTDVFRRAAD